MRQVNWDWSWEYQLSVGLSIVPLCLLGWWGLATQAAAFVAARFYCRRDLARMRRESAACFEE